MKLAVVKLAGVKLAVNNWVTVSFCLLLNACVSWQVGTQSNEIFGWGESASDRAAPNYQLSPTEQAFTRSPDWQFSGRMNITTVDRVWTGALRWHQQTREFDLTISAPFGQGVLQIKGDPYSAVLHSADGHLLESDDIQTLLQQQLGWQIPIAGLRYWVLGVPQPTIDASISRDETGKISEIRQSNWQVYIRSYQRSGAHELPRKLDLYNNQYQIRLVIHDWQLV